MSDLKYEAAIDVDVPSMSLTTCLAICNGAIDPIDMAFLVNTRCICAKTGAQYRRSVFRIKNVVSGSNMDAVDGENEGIGLANDGAYETQKW